MLEWLQRLLEPPEGPGTPFATPGLMVLDTLRFAVIIGALVIVAFTPRAAVLCSNSRGQRYGLAALTLFAIIVAGTEADHLGDYAHWRLGVALAAVGATLYRVWSLFHVPEGGTVPSRRRRRHAG